MQSNTKAITLVSFAFFGAVMLWLCAISGWNHWSSPSPLWSAVSYIVSAYTGAYWGYVYTRGKSADVRCGAIIGAALLMLLLSFASLHSGLNAWCATAPYWHAALVGFLSFGAAGLIYFYGPAPKVN